MTRMVNLKFERMRRGWSQAELARRADMNPSTVGLIESGRFLPYESQLAKLTKALGLPEAEARTLLEPAGRG
jgi:transcriptional regulator with XRE-family HTH domain